MSTILPNGYTTTLQAAEILLPTLHAGVPDLPIVTMASSRGQGSVEAGTLWPMAIGGRPGRVLRLEAEFTKQVPTLRRPRGRGFAFLCQANQDSMGTVRLHLANIRIRN